MVQNAADEVSGIYRENYSGRGMFGRECVGIILEYADSAGVVLSIATQLADNDDLEGDDEDYAELIKDYIPEVRERMSSDNMGQGVIYYFRGVRADPDTGEVRYPGDYDA
jgi:hypothetical protein